MWLALSSSSLLPVKLDAKLNSCEQVAFFDEERTSLPRSRGSDSLSVFSTSSRDSVDLDGHSRRFTLEQLCDFIAKHPSLASAQIITCSSYMQRSLFLVTHRFLVLRLHRARRKDVWLRLDRRRSTEVGLVDFSSDLGVTPANDVVSVSSRRGVSRH